MQYRLGETHIDVLLDAEMDGTEYIWVCSAFVGNSLIARITTARTPNDDITDIEFSFLRIIAWELSVTLTALLWGGEEKSDVVKQAYYNQNETKNNE